MTNEEEWIELRKCAYCAIDDGLLDGGRVGFQYHLRCMYPNFDGSPLLQRYFLPIPFQDLGLEEMPGFLQ